MTTKNELFLEQLIYLLGSNSGTPLTENDNLALVIDGIITKIPVKDLFIDFKQNDESITGYSVLGHFDVNDKNQLIHKGRTIHFLNKSNGEPIGIIEIRKPTLQNGDKKISKKQLDDYVNILRSVDKQKFNDAIENPLKESKQDPTTERTENNTVQENKENVAIKQENKPVEIKENNNDKNPTSDQSGKSSLKDFEHKDSTISTEKEKEIQKTEHTLSREDYEIEKNKLSSEGYVTHQKDDYILFHKDFGGFFIVKDRNDGYYEPLTITSRPNPNAFIVNDFLINELVTLSFDIEMPKFKGNESEIAFGGGETQ